MVLLSNSNVILVIIVIMDCRDNLQLLRQRYYYATWKADGTRYMMLITMDGCYLIDRNFNFQRVQMRFPCKSTTEVCTHIVCLEEAFWSLILFKSIFHANDLT